MLCALLWPHFPDRGASQVLRQFAKRAPGARLLMELLLIL
jgi:hypothetical protein